MESLANSAIGEFLAANYSAFLTVHVLVTAIGIGTATVTDILFFRFLKDYKLSQWEAETLNAMSKIVWTVIPLILLSGFSILLPQYERLLSQPQFITKMIIVGVIIVNGIILSGFVGPRMLRIFGEDQSTPVPRYMRRMAFAHGSISVSSWYSAFILGSYRGIGFDLSTFIFIYLAILIVAVSVSQLMEANYGKHRGNGSSL